MSGDLLFALPLGALCLWLGLFVFTLLDHSFYSLTYGRFLAGMADIERNITAVRAGSAELTSYIRRAKNPYLGRFLSKARSSRNSARIAAQVYLERVGEAAVLKQASNFAGRSRSRQITALYVLARTGHSDVLRLLEQAVGSRQPVLAYAALDMLNICDSVEAAEVLVRCIEEGILPASRIATHLEHFRTELNALYVSRLRQDDPKSRYWIAYLLGKSTYSLEAEELLSSLLSDAEAGVRKIALASLASLGAPALQRWAESMLNDPVYFVRTQAVGLLARYPTQDVVRALLPMLGDSHDAVQLATKKALVSMGAAVLEFLERALIESDGSTAAKLDEITSSIRNTIPVDKAKLTNA